MYADDTELYITFRSTAAAIKEYIMDHFHACIDEIQEWIYINMQKLNEDKQNLSYIDEGFSFCLIVFIRRANFSKTL